MKQSLFLLTALLLLASCKTTTYTYKPVSDILNTWNGLTENQLVRQLGPPTSTASDGAGGKILSYNDTKSVNIGGLLPAGYSNGYYTANITRDYTNYIQFYVDKDGKIYQNRTNYANIPEPHRTKSTTQTVLALVIAGLLVVVAVAAFNAN